MTDLEMTRLCAEAMGLEVELDAGDEYYWLGGQIFYPLENDAQAMALVKKFLMRIDRFLGIPTKWGVYSNAQFHDMTFNVDLNRAIVECVAKMHEAK